MIVLQAGNGILKQTVEDSTRKMDDSEASKRTRENDERQKTNKRNQIEIWFGGGCVEILDFLSL